MSDAPPDLPGVTHRTVPIRDGVRLHVAEAGKPGAPPVLLVHGWPQHWWIWRHLIPVLAETHHVLAPDLRGLGWSDAPSSGYRKDDMARDMLSLMDELGIEKAALVGHDWGAYTVHLMGGLAPERVERLVALSAPPPHTKPQLRNLPALRGLAHMPVLAMPVLGRRAAASPFFLGLIERLAITAKGAWSDEDRALYVDRFDDPARARAASNIYRTFLTREFLTKPAAPRAKAPVLALHGRRDPVSAKLVPAAVVIDGAGHFLPEEAPTEVNRRIAAFLA